MNGRKMNDSHRISYGRIIRRDVESIFMISLSKTDCIEQFCDFGVVHRKMQGHRAVTARCIRFLQRKLRGIRAYRVEVAVNPAQAIANRTLVNASGRHVHHHREGFMADTAVTVLTRNSICLIRHRRHINRVVASITIAPRIIFGTGSGKSCGLTLTYRGFTCNDNSRNRIHGDLNRILRRILALNGIDGLGGRNGHRIVSGFRQSHRSQVRVLFAGSEIWTVPPIGKRVCIT